MQSKRRARLAVAAVVVGAMALTGCSGSPDAAPEDEPKTLTLAVSHENDFGFVRTELSDQVQLSAAYWIPLYDTLMKRTPTLELEPNLATEWGYSDDGSTLTLTIRDDVTFTDGTKLDAEVVKDNLIAFRDGGGSDSRFLATVSEVTAPDSTTVVMTLSSPSPNLLISLSGSAGAVFSEAGLDSDDKSAVPAGSGPYVLDDARTTVGSVYTYVRNEDYWDPESYPFDELVLRPMLDVAARTNALNSGEVDGAMLPSTRAAAAEAGGLHLATGISNWAGLHLVDRDGVVVPALADVRVRQAINMVFDREAIVKNIFSGYGEVNNQVFKAASDAYLPDEKSTYPFDVDGAKKLMAEAGYADGFAVTVPAITGSHDSVMPIIKQQLGLIGITVTFEQLQFGDFLNGVLGKKYAMFYLTHPVMNPWYTIESEIAPDGLWNAFKSSDPELTKYVNQARSNDDAERKAGDQAVAQYVLDNAWFAPWAQPNVAYAMNDSIDASLSPSQSEPFLWDIKPAE